MEVAKANSPQQIGALVSSTTFDRGENKGSDKSSFLGVSWEAHGRVRADVRAEHSVLPVPSSYTCPKEVR